jgi:hypothetical protein
MAYVATHPQANQNVNSALTAWLRLRSVCTVTEPDLRPQTRGKWWGNVWQDGQTRPNAPTRGMSFFVHAQAPAHLEGKSHICFRSRPAGINTLFGPWLVTCE